MSERRVVITGLGVLAPNGHGLEAFTAALRSTRKISSDSSSVSPATVTAMVWVVSPAVKVSVPLLAV